MVITEVPSEVAALTEAFVAGLERVLGPRFIGMFQYGAAFFPPSPVTDFDAHVIVADEFDDDDRTNMKDMLATLSDIPHGDDMDVWYITQEAASRTDFPQTQLRTEPFVDEAWALHRAHVHAGRYLFRGPDPRDFVPVPTWDEIDECLQNELDDINDPLGEDSAFGVLNLCRILYSYETRDVVTSKFHSAMWAHAFVDVDDHAVIRSAINGYIEHTFRVSGDVAAFGDRMRERISSARARV
jgi:hypothetical protein